MMKNKFNNLELFMFTLKEYKRFSARIASKSLLSEYDEKDYTDVNVKLMLLRKYGNKKENVYIGTIIEDAIQKYNEKSKELNSILLEHNNLEEQQVELILSDGTKRNLYEVIEDVMYGVYLHADNDRIQRLKKSDENLRFACVRKYVEDFEEILFKLYDCLSDCELIENENTKEKASIIYLGNSDENTQEIKKSPYWSNLYGHDGTDDDVKNLLEQYNFEDYEIQLKCLIFLEELKKDEKSFDILDSLILPSTKDGWGDYTDAASFYKSIINPGISTKIRYNENHSKAYVRIFQQVEEVFVIDSPHILNNLYEICLVKENEKSEWKIFSLGGHVD